MTCIRCRSAEAPHPLGYCPACAVHTQIEVAGGLRQVAAYLAAWAAFEDWLRMQRFEAEGGAAARGGP